MAYESPITIFVSDVESKLTKEFDVTIVKTVQKYFPYVDRDELLKALEYDRGQYEAGYADGHAARDADIVRCKDCKHYWKVEGRCAHGTVERFRMASTDPGGFCSCGERRDDGNG